MTDINRTLKLNAKPETVFLWLTEPEYMQKWFADSVDANHDSMSFKWKLQDDGSAGFDVLITISDAPHTFAYKATDNSEISTRFDVASDGENTILALSESGFSDDDAGAILRQEHEGGWDWFLSRLQGLDE